MHNPSQHAQFVVVANSFVVVEPIQDIAIIIRNPRTSQPCQNQVRFQSSLKFKTSLKTFRTSLCYSPKKSQDKPTMLEPKNVSGLVKVQDLVKSAGHRYNPRKSKENQLWSNQLMFQTSLKFKTSKKFRTSLQPQEIPRQTNYVRTN